MLYILFPFILLVAMILGLSSESERGLLRAFLLRANLSNPMCSIIFEVVQVGW